MGILNTHLDFMDFSVNKYPSRNIKQNFEAYFYEYFKKSKFDSGHTYIPIQWTNYLVQNNYGKNIDGLKTFLRENLNSSKKYFTIVQYAGGPLVELENTLIFSMGGTFNTKIPKSSEVIPLPLIYNSESNVIKDLEKNI